MLTSHILKTLHQEILEDFEAKRITEGERDKRFLVLHQKAMDWDLEYKIDPKLTPVTHKNTYKTRPYDEDWMIKLNNTMKYYYPSVERFSSETPAVTDGTGSTLYSDIVSITNETGRTSAELSSPKKVITPEQEKFEKKAKEQEAEISKLLGPEEPFDDFWFYEPWL